MFPPLLIQFMQLLGGICAFISIPLVSFSYKNTYINKGRHDDAQGKIIIVNRIEDICVALLTSISIPLLTMLIKYVQN